MQQNNNIGYQLVNNGMLAPNRVTSTGKIKKAKKTDIFTDICNKEGICKGLVKDYSMRITPTMFNELQGNLFQGKPVERQVLDEDMSIPSQTLRHACTGTKNIVFLTLNSGTIMLPEKYKGQVVNMLPINIPFYYCGACNKFYIMREGEKVKVLDEEMSSATKFIRHACSARKCISNIKQGKCNCDLRSIKAQRGIHYLPRSTASFIDHMGMQRSIVYYICKGCGDIYCFTDMMETLNIQYGL